MDFLPQSLALLASYRQFIVYILQDSKARPGKTDKLPIDYRSGQVANAHDQAIWTDAQTAIATANAFGDQYGVGFVFTKDDPFFFLDIDDCIARCGTKWNDIAITMLSTFHGAAVEISSSGRGLHIIGSGRVPPHGCRNAEHKLELYTQGRFVALTGNGAMGSASNDSSVQLIWLVDQYFSNQTEPKTSHEWTKEATDGWNGDLDDDKLLARMLKSQPASAVFGDGVTFRDLYEANEAVLSKHYPPNDTDIYDRSAADAALAQRLAFWTGNNCERIQRLMEGSALKREKWEREDYLPRTILAVCGRQKDFLQDKPPQYTINDLQTEVEKPRPQLVKGSTFLTIDNQIDYFAGCVYVADEHKVLTPDGYLLTPERFKAVYGGYIMPLDSANTKTTRNAFEAFTESQAFRSPKVESTCFQPTRTPGGIVVKDGQRLANVYHPIITPRMEGDPTPFLNHMLKVFPNVDDREIMLAYLAAVIQYPGIKFQWAPLIQGVQGNGKTLITRIVAFCIGQRYCHFPRAEDIDNKFNGWLYQRLFIGVEDIYLPDSRTHVIETLKPMVTNERQEIEIKGRDKVTVDICANFIINTNHKDGLRKTRDDRRFAVFYTAQQTIDDLKRAGMLGDYFPKLRHWLQSGGYAIVHHLLATYKIPEELNPATLCIRAPQTSSTEAAIANGVGRIEQEVLEAIAEGVPGFRGAWVSSIALDKLLDRIKASYIVPRRKRREMMQSLGYDWHPALKEGRMTKIVQPDGSKPTLYIKMNDIQAMLGTTEEVAKAYTEAQTKD